MSSRVMSPARQKLLSTLAHKSFRLGEFKLSSGGTSDYYIDCRTTTLDATGARLTGDGFLVRKAEKQHGTGQRIEGFREKGARVVIVDDVCTTGASTVQAIEAAREFGFQVVGAMCLVEREEAKGRPNVEKAAAPAPFVSIFTARDVRREHMRQNDDTAPVIFAVAAVCEVCGRPAVTSNPRNRCAEHKS